MKIGKHKKKAEKSHTLARMELKNKLDPLTPRSD